MANPQGLTAEAIPAAKANPRGANSPRPPRKELELPDSDSTNPLTPSIPSSFPMSFAATNAPTRATMAIMAGSPTRRRNAGASAAMDKFLEIDIVSDLPDRRVLSG